MPRRPRTHQPGGYYHVTLRGNHRQPIFACAADREILDSIVAESTYELEARVHAYCWMSNHIHAIVQVGEEPLGRIMQRVATRYSRYFQKSLKTTGHLFERRYHAVLVASDAQLLAAVRYVHLNPVRAGLVADPSAYCWSGHRGYLGLGGPAWLYSEFVLTMLDVRPDRARAAYAAFVAGAELNGGGEGASPAPSATAPDGSAGTCRKRSDGLPPAMRETLDGLITRICAEEGIAEGELRDRSKDRRLTGIRVRIALEATRSAVCSLSEVARRLDRHITSLSKAISRRRNA
jgi:REP element-mobilizing transposase RayT